MTDKTKFKEIDYSRLTEVVSSAVASTGWEIRSMGKTSRINYNIGFNLYIRRRKLSCLMSENAANQRMIGVNGIENSKKSDQTNPANTEEIYISDKSKEKQKQDIAQFAISSVTRGNENLPVLSNFSDYQSLNNISSGKPAIVIAFDSEWYYPGGEDKNGRVVLSWQFSVIDGEDLVEFVFVRKKADAAFHVEMAIGRILDYLKVKSVNIREVRKYQSITGSDKTTGDDKITLFDTIEEAKQNSIQLFDDGKIYHIKHDWSKTKHIPVVLLSHAGLADITTFDHNRKYNEYILKYCCEVQGGLITLNPIKIYPRSLNPKFAKNNNTFEYPVTLHVSDTMCHAPSKMKSLKNLGKTIGWEKIQLNEGEIKHMDNLLITNPCAYFEYASNDSNVALLYAAALYGYNKILPPTITSASAKIMKNVMMEYLHCENSKQFNRKYRGLMSINQGLVKNGDVPGFIQTSNLEPVSDKANLIQIYASGAFHGGYNSTSDIGYFPQKTYDYDLQNVYPTAICLVPDIDWDNPIREEITGRELREEDFRNPDGSEYCPLTMMFAYVNFEFPPEVKYPCIPVKVDGFPIFPSTSEGVEGVYACGPELFLALKLEAKVTVEKGFILNSIIDSENKMESYSLKTAVKQLVKDRNKAKEDFGKKSLEELILKTMVNSGYGKNAQNIIPKKKRSAIDNTMKDIGCSAISNPVSASMITSIVRAELLAVQNQCHQLGYMTCSVTTDGFISDVPEEVLKSLDLYGLRPYMEKSRLFLTDNKDKEAWEM